MTLSTKLLKLFNAGTTVIYALTGLALLMISLVMIGYALWEIWYAMYVSGTLITTMLDAIGLIVIAIAVFDVSKYLMEEEVFRYQRELGSPREARRTLTKFLVIIIIAVSLEALVFIFGAGSSDIASLIYPTLLLVAAVLMVVGLGWYQRLSLGTEGALPRKKR